MRQAKRGARSTSALLARPRRRSQATIRVLIAPGLGELAAAIEQRSLEFEVVPLEQPAEGLFVTIEVHQDGRELAVVRLKGLGVTGSIPLRVPLHEPCCGVPGVLRVRSNAALRLIF